MKKFVKIALLIAVICCILGGALLVIGWGNGGLTELSKTDISPTIGSVSNYKKHTLDKKKLPDFIEIETDLSYTDLNILPSENDTCYLSYKIYNNNNSEPIYYEIKDNTLYLKDDESADSYFQIDYSYFINVLRGKQSSYDFENSVTLYLPATKILESAAISMDSGDLSIDGFQAKQFSLKMDYGDFTIKNSTIHQGNLSLSDGDFTSSKTSLPGQTKVTLSYGDANIDLTKEQKASLALHLSTDYGDISVSKEINGTLSIQDEEDFQLFDRTGNNPEESLSIKSSDGDIAIR